jgi:hypothetical protein
MSSFADDMREWIIDMTLNGSLNVFVDYAPDKTDFIACFNTGGRESTIPLDASYIEEHPSVQIICNHIDSSVARNTLYNIKANLINKHDVIIGDYRYCLFTTLGDVLYISRNDENRTKYGLNIRTIRTRT